MISISKILYRNKYLVLIHFYKKINFKIHFQFFEILDKHIKKYLFDIKFFSIFSRRNTLSLYIFLFHSKIFKIQFKLGLLEIQVLFFPVSHFFPFRNVKCKKLECVKPNVIIKILKKRISQSEFYNL